MDKGPPEKDALFFVLSSKDYHVCINVSEREFAKKIIIEVGGVIREWRDAHGTPAKVDTAFWTSLIAKAMPGLRGWE